MSHTMIVIVAGLVMLGVMVFTAKGNISGAVRRFLLLWFGLSIVNMLVGVYSAGYSFREELPIMALVFGVPAVAAMLVGAVLKRR